MNNNDIRKYFKELLWVILPYYMNLYKQILINKLSAQTFRSGLNFRVFS